MDFVLLIIGGILLRYWHTDMTVDRFERPRFLHEHGQKVAILGLTLVS